MSKSSEPEREWRPIGWWRAVDSDGQMWCESPDEAEVRAAARPGDVVERLWSEVPCGEWRQDRA